MSRIAPTETSTRRYCVDTAHLSAKTASTDWSSQPPDFGTDTPPSHLHYLLKLSTFTSMITRPDFSSTLEELDFPTQSFFRRHRFSDRTDRTDRTDNIRSATGKEKEQQAEDNRHLSPFLPPFTDDELNCLAAASGSRRSEVSSTSACRGALAGSTRSGPTIVTNSTLALGHVPSRSGGQTVISDGDPLPFLYLV
ncbi:uncharacterized protein EHS24_005378 [Apiotrichum porosum]|uniref:Uncharacterized protein n=1 Tax=Apiotrichum porosum TaxID=105984 RepID=A0A427XCT0_9TREE|nr:uncharacterized protein EHS24_005378 [Apiotrichum porosum]RSH76632.1 hypothetical protein EHS24_005378 [Apiotrichum porosum]